MIESNSNAHAENSAENSVNRRGNPDKIKHFQFKPGQSGNPGGRPKSAPVTNLLREILEKDDGKEAIRLAKAIIKEAAKGNVKAFEAIVNRVEGPPQRRANTTSDNDGPMRVVVEHIRAEPPTTTE